MRLQAGSMALRTTIKLKLRASGYRLVYEATDNDICVLVIAVGKRDKKEVYKQASKRKKG